MEKDQLVEPGYKSEPSELVFPNNTTHHRNQTMCQARSRDPPPYNNIPKSEWQGVSLPVAGTLRKAVETQQVSRCLLGKGNVSEAPFLSPRLASSTQTSFLFN